MKKYFSVKTSVKLLNHLNFLKLYIYKPFNTYFLYTLFFGETRKVIFKFANRKDVPLTGTKYEGQPLNITRLSSADNYIKIYILQINSKTEWHAMQR
jgi:hypothetical protein